MRPSRILLCLIAMLIPAAPASAAAPHTVQPGETLWSIAAANNLTTRTVAAFNGLSEDAQVVLGSTVMVPTTVEGYAALQRTGAVPATPTASAAVSPAPTASGGSYTVQAGDTLTAIAGRAGVSVQSLAAANGLDPAGLLIAGSTLRLAGGGAAPAASSAPTGGPAPQGAYKVRQGDTLGSLAAPDRRVGQRDGGDERPRPEWDPARRHRAQAADGRSGTGGGEHARAGPDGRPERGARADRAAPDRRRRPEHRRRARGLPLARRRDRLAGERVQQRHGVRRQRARRDAGDARHVGLRAAEPRRRPAAQRGVGDRQRARRA